MFTNVHGKDDDILHAYNKAMFGFLYLKWKYDSILTDKTEHKTTKTDPVERIGFRFKS